MDCYDKAYDKVAKWMKQKKMTWGEWTGPVLASMLVELDGTGKAGGLGHILAVVSLVEEVHGGSSVTKDSIVSVVKKSILKKNRAVMPKKMRVPFSRGMMRRVVSVCWKQGVSASMRRFAVKTSWLYFGLRRHDDIARVRWEDCKFSKEEGSVEVILRKTKTNQLGESQRMVLAAGRGARTMAKMFSWYKGSWGEQPPRGGFVFPTLVGSGRPSWGKEQTYSSYNMELKSFCKEQDLPLVTPHGGRSGGATAASRLQVNRNVIMDQGGWRSGCVDRYIITEGDTGEVGQKLFEDVEKNDV